ncbi:MAG: serine/threonine-protein kinase [Lysobacterales bacterium]
MATPEIPGYKLLKQIGSGGMATVYLAVQISLDRKVAIKVLRSAGDDDPERTEKRFLREGRTLAKITHKNVCGIYDIAKVDELAYIAMEYLDGGTLVDQLKRGVSVGEAIAIVVQVASALEEAHKLGIIHRDLKPANVMLRGGRVPVLTDFGIARELTASQTRITAENMIVGTPIYMSPEQVSGGEVDGRSDLYALGIMFYELLTGQPPFKGDTPIAVCMQHLTAPLPTMPPSLADLQPVMDRMLAKRREDRYSSMSEFTHALREVFVDSDAMREAASFSPDTPWSEQLRDLGFSFDTLRDAEFKAALTEQRRAVGPGKRAATKKKKAAVKTGAPARPWYLYLAVALVLTVLAVGAGWMALRTKPPTENEDRLLTFLRTEFAERMEMGQLYEPMGDSALDTVRKMQEVHQTAEQTVEALRTLRASLVEKARGELARRDLLALDVTLGVLEERLPDTPELAELKSGRENLASTLAREVAIRAQLDRLRELVDGATPRPGETVQRLIVQLHPVLASDPKFQALEPRAVAAARVAIEASIAAGETRSALDAAIELADLFDNDPELAKLVASLKQTVAAAEIQQAVDEWNRVLAAPGEMDSARLATLLSGLARLDELGQATADLVQMRQLLSTVVLSEANSMVGRGDYDGALALIGQARADLVTVPVLIEAQNRIGAEREAASEANRQAALKARQGQVAISSAPWAKVEQVVDGAGKRIALPADAATPLLLTLPEGRYLVTLVSGQGGGKRQEGVKIESGKLTRVTVSFEGYDADAFMREGGW